MSDAIRPTEAISLLPCPFCGSPAKTSLKYSSTEIEWGDGLGSPGRHTWPHNTVKCANFKCMAEVHDNTPEKAAECWNRRIAPEPGVPREHHEQVLSHWKKEYDRAAAASLAWMERYESAAVFLRHVQQTLAGRDEWPELSKLLDEQPETKAAPEPGALRSAVEQFIHTAQSTVGRMNVHANQGEAGKCHSDIKTLKAATEELMKAHGGYEVPPQLSLTKSALPDAHNQTEGEKHVE